VSRPAQGELALAPPRGAAGVRPAPGAGAGAEPDADWPNRAASELVEAAGLRWHVQRQGAGPSVLLVHGTGASTHSWRDLAPALAAHCHVVAMDLPGHAFTPALAGRAQSLEGMAAALGALLRRLRCEPTLVVGHSAGAAIAARLCLDGVIAPQHLVSLNGALLPFTGLAGHLFAPIAKVLASGDLAARLIAARARDPRAVQRLLAGTGSRIDPFGEALYRRLIQSPGHVAAVLRMMANWRLEALSEALPRLAPRLTLVAAGHDRAVPPAQAERVRALVPGARVRHLAGLGHLAHEEAPARLAALLLDVLRSRSGPGGEAEPCS